MRPIASVAVVATVAALTACGGTTTSGSPTPSPTPSASAEPTPSDTGSTGVVLEQAAIWPAASVHFDSPTAAAEDFVTNALGVPAVLGEFMAGDSRSGEIEVLSAGEPGATRVARGLLLLRQLGSDGGWYVLAAPNDVVTITTLEQGAEVPAGPITVGGVARGFEGAVKITAFVAGDHMRVLDQQYTLAGSMEDPMPYEVTLDVSGATAGDMVAILVQGGTGLETDPGDFAGIVVIVEGGTGDGAGIANPASVFCEEQGGTVEIVTADDGSQSGLCHLPDGTTVDEWEYYTANHPEDSEG